MAGVTCVQVSISLALTYLANADDIALLGDSYEAVQEMINGFQRCQDQGAVRTDEPSKPWHDHSGWCAFGGSLVVLVPWSLLCGDRASCWRNRRENQHSASDLQSTVYLAVVEARNFAPHKRPHLRVAG